MVIFSSVNEYINSGLNDAIVDSDPELIYAKRKLAREQTKTSKETVPSTSITSIYHSFSASREGEGQLPNEWWGISLQKIPFFSRAEMDKYVSRTGKSLGCAGKKSVPTGLKKAATFLKDEYLKEIESHDDQRYFFMRCKCYHSFRKNDPPHNIFLALCIVSGEVEDSKCTCVAGSLGYCNHSLALKLKACKFSLYGSQNTKDLENESDQIPGQACTSKLQTWHQKGRAETIYPRPIMDVVISKTKLEDTKRGNDGIRSLLYEARNNVVYTGTEEHKFKEAIRRINPPMGLAQIANLGSDIHLKETRFGHSPVGSYARYQLTHTESNFNVCVDISSVPRETKNNQLLSYPSFPLKDHGTPTVENNQLTDLERDLHESLCIDQETVSAIEKETRDQSHSERWKLERKYRFTASQFYFIACIKRHCLIRGKPAE